MRNILFLIAAVVFFWAVPANAANVKIATFNTESDADSDPAKVAETFDSIKGVDVWALQEVESAAAVDLYMQNAGAGKWRYVISESGKSHKVGRKNDYLAIMYRTDMFRQLETVELHSIRSKPAEGKPYGATNWGLRGALLVRLQHKVSGKVFWVGNTHLKCCGGKGLTIRDHQTKLLMNWLKGRGGDVVLTGDFNIPVAPDAESGSPNSKAFQNLITAGLDWVRPSNPIKTQCSEDYNSMLDHFFSNLSGEVSTEIQKTDESYCEVEKDGYADHRPVVLTAKM